MAHNKEHDCLATVEYAQCKPCMKKSQWSNRQAYSKAKAYAIVMPSTHTFAHRQYLWSPSPFSAWPKRKKKQVSRVTNPRASVNKVNQTIKPSDNIYSSINHCQAHFRNKTLASWKMFLFKNTNHTTHFASKTKHFVDTGCVFTKQGFILSSSLVTLHSSAETLSSNW